MTTGATPSAGQPSASGVRRGGDDFQDLVVWKAALRLVQPRAHYDLLEVEQNGVGSLDDAILRTADPAVTGDSFTQVKWATKESSYLDEGFLTEVPSGGSRSLLRKLYDSYVLLRDREAQGEFTMELFTNRVIDPNHPLLSLADGRTGFLMPAAGQAAPRSNAGKTVSEWAQHLDVDRAELLELLTVLRWRPGRDRAGERDHAKTLMLAAGLRSDEAALDRALYAAGEWVRSGQREVTADHVTKLINNLDLRAGQPTATLLIDGIDHAPDPQAATVHLDWVDTYAEDAPALRRNPAQPSAWADAQADLERAAGEIEGAGLDRVYVRGYFRQATAFSVGARLAKARGFEIDYKQGPTMWSTDAPRTSADLVFETVEITAGTELAVVVSIAADAAAEVRAYLAATDLPVGSLVVIRPGDGPNDEAVSGAGHAVGIAGEVRRTLRAHLAGAASIERIHLFLVGPNGLAMMLGHRWNGLRPTVVYEHLGPGRGYVPAFKVDS